MKINRKKRQEAATSTEKMLFFPENSFQNKRDDFAN